MEKIILPVLAKHFINADYNSNCYCAVANAAKEFFNLPYANEGVSIISVGENEYTLTEYTHRLYSFNDFLQDAAAAEKSKYDSTVILNLELIPYERNV